MLNPQGLYDPVNEHDACGVGFLASLKNKRSHQIVKDALRVLRNLEHRGACGCDALTGDGAGILIQLPEEFMRTVAAPQAGITLPAPGQYGVGLVFLPRAEGEAAICQRLFEKIIQEEGQAFLGWRKVPVDNTTIGEGARAVEPAIQHVFIGWGADVTDDMGFERKLFVIRKRVEHAVAQAGITETSYFHVPSLSSRTLIYKGLLLADQVAKFYTDLADERMTSALALVHQRYSTNTMPTWDLAHPFHYLAHNGEINTLRGNANWMHARQSLMKTPLLPEIEKIFPAIRPGQSDSACLDNALELLYMTGRSLPHCASMLIPEPWENHQFMSAEKRAFYEYHSFLMEPWDGPASIAFTDGKVIGATLDRNGLRPSRYWVTKDGLVIMASEAGVIDDIPVDQIEQKGRLQPGRMFICDLEQGRIVSDDEIKHALASRRPYAQWLSENVIHINELDAVPAAAPLGEELLVQQQAFGYTLEDLKVLLGPMARDGKEPIGSMGNDTALAVLSDRPRLLFDYFKQLFAQVTNPPLDAIREEIVTAIGTTLGSEGNLFDETPQQAHQVRLDQMILTDEEVARLKTLDRGTLRARVLPILFPRGSGAEGMRKALDELFAAATQAVDDGITIIVLSDRGVNHDRLALPSLLAMAGLHHHLIREGTRTRVGLVLESAEPREVHHFALLCGYGCGAVNPYLAFETIEQMRQRGELGTLTAEKVVDNYIHAVNAGVLKAMSKMGISTLESYRGAQIFEAVGINSEVIDRYFTWTSSRIEGIGLDAIAEEAQRRHGAGFPERQVASNLDLDMGGQYQWRRGGERHMINPFTISKLQEATRTGSAKTFAEFSQLCNEDARNRCTLRGLLKFRKGTPVPLDEVEPAKEIVKRFKTGAMSYGSISQEAHETLAVAMNRLGGKSNTGEGGEDPERYGTEKNSAIKQVASGRFGVTINYLASAVEIQIKMAQGAKPGEGGQLPGEKVYPWVAKTRYSTPYVGLISPPPHHDIYSIEDLAQLIHDLKNSNPAARISVKLVSEVGVGTIAAGVAKGKAEVVLISGHDGGTGASPLTSIKHCGLPWELGLAETHQTLLVNNLRSRITVETDGQLKTGRDVAVAVLLGAEEYGFSTAPLISIGCIMMRKCHLNTCPVGVATQDPVLRQKFDGKPEYVINYFFFVAEELRKIMAELGFRTINEMVGRVDMLDANEAIEHWKVDGIDLGKLLHRVQVPESHGSYCQMPQDHALDRALDNKLIELAQPAITRGERVQFELPIRNINRTVGTMLSHEIAKAHGLELLPDDTVHVRFTGTAGNSLGCFLAKGVTFEIEGDANDYFGKGLSGGRLVIYPPRQATFVPEDNIIIGNVAFYGATRGEAFVRGQAGERFCVRNSGVNVVVEGVGDHGCEYMTGGKAVIIGKTGRNFAAGMSGGIAYVLDEDEQFAPRCNMEMVDLDPLEAEDEQFLHDMIEKHLLLTGSGVAQRLLADWESTLARFVKVMPRDYKKALKRLAEEEALQTQSA